MATDLNQATADDLKRAAQVDDKRVEHLISKRDEMGGFKSWDDVKKVPGFSEGMVQNLQEAGMTVGSQQGQQKGQSERTRQ